MEEKEQAFQSLIHVLNLNSKKENKDFWAIYFHFWRFFYTFNESLEKSAKLEEKVALIEEFMNYAKELGVVEEKLLQQHKVDKKNLPPEQDLQMTPHVAHMKELFKKEEKRFSRLMRGVKKQKTPLAKKGPSKRKWLRT